jgi:YidC/Oxa1 family membrane protein insertase
METKNAFLAIVLSMAVLFGYQFLFPQQPVPQPEPVQPSQAVPAAASAPTYPAAVVVVGSPAGQAPVPSGATRTGRDIAVETDLYSAIFSENGGAIKSFRLNNYRESIEPDSDLMELIRAGASLERPLFFSWGADPETITAVPYFKADRTKVVTGRPDGRATLVMTGQLADGLIVTRSMTFHNDNYLLDLRIEVANHSATALQGSPYLTLSGRPFSAESENSRLFSGPALLVDGSLEEVNAQKLQKDGPRTFQGAITWAAYEDTYFMLAAAPEAEAAATQTVRLSSADGETVKNIMSGPAEVIAPGASREYRYALYIGPKKMAGLKKVGHDFQRAINFGWFGFVAKPVLMLLNLVYKLIHNYGIAIILVTVLIKLLFWPITQKGMKSMKNMQNLQPKLTKLREKYKDDKERMAQEQMKLYQTHKINPLGGCLPMVLQIPVFFALYQVLMQAIELRHAPFMLWMTDLSAPERLAIGFQLPYTGGLPLLTLLMGGTMYLQQKMTPATAANPEMARMMMLMPVIFTFLFINFASGLVLYFFVNNILQMAQQHFINKDS